MAGAEKGVSIIWDCQKSFAAPRARPPSTTTKMGAAAMPLI